MEHRAEITISESNTTGVTVITEVNGFWYGNISYDENKFNIIDLPAAFTKRGHRATTDSMFDIHFRNTT